MDLTSRCGQCVTGTDPTHWAGWRARNAVTLEARRGCTSLLRIEDNRGSKSQQTNHSIRLSHQRSPSSSGPPPRAARVPLLRSSTSAAIRRMLDNAVCWHIDQDPSRPHPSHSVAIEIHVSHRSVSASSGSQFLLCFRTTLAGTTGYSLASAGHPHYFSTPIALAWWVAMVLVPMVLVKYFLSEPRFLFS